MPGRLGWFVAKAQRNFQAHVLGRTIRDYLEIGVFAGDSFFWVLDNVRPVRAIGIDPYGPDRERSAEETAAIGDAVAARLIEYPGAELIREESRFALPRLAADTWRFDLIYVDGSHAGPDVLFDAVLSWELLRPGGLLIFDDWLVRAMRHVRGLREAVTTFVRLHADWVDVLAVNTQVVLARRTAAGPPSTLVRARFLTP